MGDEPRKLIAIRLDAKVLGWLRKTAEKKGLPYQSLVNEILASEMRKAINQYAVLTPNPSRSDRGLDNHRSRHRRFPNGKRGCESVRSEMSHPLGSTIEIQSLPQQ